MPGAFIACSPPQQCVGSKGRHSSFHTLVLTTTTHLTLNETTTLQLDTSLLNALKTEIQAKAEVKGNLDTYKYYDNVSCTECLALSLLGCFEYRQRMPKCCWLLVVAADQGLLQLCSDAPGSLVLCSFPPPSSCASCMYNQHHHHYHHYHLNHHHHQHRCGSSLC